MEDEEEEEGAGASGATAARMSPAPQEAPSPAPLSATASLASLCSCFIFSFHHWPFCENYISSRPSEAFCLEYFLSNDLVSGHFELIGNKLRRKDCQGDHLSY